MNFIRLVFSMIYFFDKKFSGRSIANEPNYQLANELHKPILQNQKKEVYFSSRDSIWAIDLADLQSLSKYKGNKYLLCAIDLFGKYAWVVFLKDKKGTSQYISKDNFRRKPNKIWVDQGNDFYNNSFKDFLKINNLEIYSAHNEGKSVAKRFIRTLKNKTFKHMTAFSKKCLF